MDEMTSFDPIEDTLQEINAEETPKQDEGAEQSVEQVETAQAEGEINPEVREEVKDALKKPENMTKQQEYDWEKKAIERAVKLMQREGVEPEQAKKFIYQSFINADRKIQETSTKLKEFETKNADLSRYQKFYEDASKLPEFRALLEGKAKIVMNGAGEPEVQDQYGEVVKDPRVDQLMSYIQAKEAKERQQSEQAAQEKVQAELKSRVNEDFKKVLSDSRFGTFKDWVDEYKKSGVMPVELQEITDMIKEAESRGETLTLPSAVRNYYFDKGIPIIQEKTRQETINRMKSKAAKNTEGAGKANIADKVFKRTNDPGDIIDQLNQIE